MAPPRDTGRGGCVFGKVDIAIENEFDSEFDFTFISFGGGASYKLSDNYTLFSSMLFKKFTNLEYTHAGSSGSKSIGSTYSDLYLGVQRTFGEFLITAGYDNLNYFAGQSGSIVEPIRIDRVSGKASWLKYNRFVPSFKLGVLLPVFDDVNGIDFNISGKYFIQESKKIFINAYYYKAILKVEGDNADSNSLGLGAGYLF